MDGMNGVGPGAVDLGALRRAEVPAELRAAAEVEGEVRAGLRCGGCQRRVTSGFRVHAVLVALIGGKGAIEHRTQTCCVDPECGYLLTLLRSPHSRAVERVAYRFLDDEATRAALGLDPSPPEPADPMPVAPEPEPVSS